MSGRNLEGELDRVSLYLTKRRRSAPRNELDTRDRVVLPLLRSLGYGEDDIRSESDEVGTSSPDYCVLPGTRKRWYVEVRSWTSALDPEVAIPVVHHAERQGSRWAVLTNGRAWHLYDAQHVTVPAAEREIASADLSDPDRLKHFLELVSKRSVVSGGLARWADVHSLGVFLYQQLSRTSNLTDLVADYCTEHGYVNANSAAVTAYFRKTLAPPLESAPSRRARPIARRNARKPSSQAGIKHSLMQLANKNPDPTHRLPLRVVLPDGSIEEVRSWKELAIAVATYVLRVSPNLRMPVQTTRGRTFFLHDQPIHRDGRPMREPCPITAGDRNVFMEAHQSARSMCESLMELLAFSGVRPDKVVIEVTNRSHSRTSTSV